MKNASETPAIKTRTGRTAALGARIKPELKAAMETAAREAGISVNAWIEQAVRARLVADGYLSRPVSKARKTEGGQ